MGNKYLDFEKPIAELENKIEELRMLGSDNKINIAEEIIKLEKKSQEKIRTIFKSLSAWQVVQLARHPLRPHTLDYIPRIFENFIELHGDRTFSDDKAIVGGMAKINKISVMIVGHQKGRDTKEKLERNFGMPHPEGYRKAKRLFNIANRFSMPIICFIDTPGAYPGIGAEDRGQSEAIATNLMEMSKLHVPIICVILGEGCSGGALGIGVGDKTLILQYAYFATISPEGCASILWKDAGKAIEASEVMHITAEKLLAHGLVDEIITEPLGGAHRAYNEIANSLKARLIYHIKILQTVPKDKLVDNRINKLFAVGHDPNN